MYYALYKSSEKILDEHGYPTGDLRAVYAEPVLLMANVSPAKGSSQVEQFGSLSGYDRVLITDDLSCPINETSVLFVDAPVAFTDSGDPLFDYVVLRVGKSLTSIAYAIAKVEVS